MRRLVQETAARTEARASVAEFHRAEGATPLATFDLGAEGLTGRSRDRSPAGAIVRVVPLSDAVEFDRREVEAALKREGALHVWFAPRQGKKRAVARRAEGEAPRASQTVRQVVDGLVQKANTKDRDLLSKIVNAALDEAGA